jgi:hypothetical protein
VEHDVGQHIDADLRMLAREVGVVDGAVEGRVGVEIAVPLNSMCSRKCESPAPRWSPSWMLPVRTHACTETSGAERSVLRMRVRPFGRIVRSTSSSQKGSSSFRSE